MSRSMLASAVMVSSVVCMCLSPMGINAQSLTPADARAIAKEAYIYGFPLVDSYRILYSYFVDRSSPEYKANWNERIANNPRVFTPDDKAMQTPNSDTPYSQLGLDLRAEPMVLSMPAIEKDATTRPRSTIFTPSSPAISAAARPATMPATSSLPGRAGKARSRKASRP